MNAEGPGTYNLLIAAAERTNPPVYRARTAIARGLSTSFICIAFSPHMHLKNLSLVWISIRTRVTWICSVRLALLAPGQGLSLHHILTKCFGWLFQNKMTVRHSHTGSPCESNRSTSSINSRSTRRCLLSAPPLFSKSSPCTDVAVDTARLVIY